MKQTSTKKKKKTLKILVRLTRKYTHHILKCSVERENPKERSIIIIRQILHCYLQWQNQKHGVYNSNSLTRQLDSKNLMRKKD